MLTKLARLTLSVIGVFLMSVILALPASAAEIQLPPDSFAAPGPVTFEGKPINLKAGWGAARSCVVFADQHVQCYRSYSQADAATVTNGSQASTQAQAGTNAAAVDAPFACAVGWLCLYGNPGGQGRRLLFSDEYWHHLAAYGFEDLTKSWRNNQTFCNDTGILGDGVGGALVLDGCSRSSALNSYWSYAVVDVHG